MERAEHQPVMVEEVCGLLAPRAGGLYVDGTVGQGGHAEEILRRSAPDGRLHGLDLDEDSLAEARRRLSPFGERVTLAQGDYRRLPELAPGLQPDGLLVDLGLATPQLADATRGFSFRLDGPLDMRFDRRSAGPTAADLVNGEAEAALAAIFRRYGEEPRARAIAREIVRRRDLRPLRSTGELREAVLAATGSRPGARIDPATRTFQALRIAVNRELDGLEPFLQAAARMLREGGVLAVIAYHSLEDRIVKRTFAGLARPCTCPPGLPVCACRRLGEPGFTLLTRKVLVPGPAERERNPRCRSARLRALKKEGAEA